MLEENKKQTRTWYDGKNNTKEVGLNFIFIELNKNKNRILKKMLNFSLNYLPLYLASVAEICTQKLCNFRVLATVKNSAINRVFPIWPIAELPNLCFPNT